MQNFPKHRKPSDELPDSYPAEMFIDFVLTQGYTLVEDAPTYTIVKNEELGMSSRFSSILIPHFLTSSTCYPNERISQENVSLPNKCRDANRTGAPKI